MDLKTIRSTPPDPSEYAPYYGRYVALVPAGDLMDTLTAQLDEIQKLFAGLSEPQGDYRYAEGKWSVKEVLGHINDTERVFSYRVLRAARGDRTPMQSFDQDAFVATGPFASTSLAAVREEFAAIRRATLSLLAPLSAEAWMRRGIANGNEVSVRAIAWMTGGHVQHHLSILRDRYSL